MQSSELLRGLVLGLVQGITEFLPVSSSAHLILVPEWLGWPDQGLAFDIAANTGTLVALLVYFRRDLLSVLQHWRRGRGRERLRIVDDGEPVVMPRLTWLALATIPVGVAGLLMADLVATDLRHPLVIAATTLGFGVLLLVADRLHERWKGRGEVKLPGETEPTTPPLRDALVLGLAQALALVPGTSRSGVVLTAALLRSYDREDSARLAFLMAIPVGFLVAAKDLWDLAQSPAAVQWTLLISGFVASAIAGYAVIALLLDWLRRRTLMVFVVYRMVLGVALLLWFGFEGGVGG